MLDFKEGGREESNSAENMERCHWLPWRRKAVWICREDPINLIDPLGLDARPADTSTPVPTMRPFPPTMGGFEGDPDNWSRYPVGVARESFTVAIIATPKMDERHGLALKISAAM